MGTNYDLDIKTSIAVLQEDNLKLRRSLRRYSALFMFNIVIFVCVFIYFFHTPVNARDLLPVKDQNEIERDKINRRINKLGNQVYKYQKQTDRRLGSHGKSLNVISYVASTQHQDKYNYAINNPQAVRTWATMQRAKRHTPSKGKGDTGQRRYRLPYRGK